MEGNALPDHATTQKQLEALYLNSSEMMCIVGSDGYFKQVNPAFTSVLGYTEAELLSAPLVTLAHPDDSIDAIDIIHDLGLHAGKLNFEHRYRSKDGSYRWLNWAASSAADGNIYAIVRDVSDRKKQDEMSRNLAAIVDSSDDAIIGLDLDSKITSWNRGAERMYGYTAQDAIGQSITLLYVPEDSSELLMERVKRGERIEHAEARRRRKDGTIVEEAITFSPVYDAAGTLVGASKIARDVTGVKQQDELRRELAAIVESSDDAIIGLDLDSTITSWNQGAERMYGYAAQEAIGKSIKLLYLPDDNSELFMDRIKRGERVEHAEARRRHKDGSIIEEAITISPIYDAAGTLIGSSKIARDVTGVKKQDELRRALAAIVESSDDAIIGLDLDSTITSWNQGAERMYGYTAQEAIGQSIKLLYLPDDNSELFMDRIKRGERVEHAEARRRRKDGTIIDEAITISPMVDASGALIGASKIARDVTHVKKQDALRRELAAIVESSDDAIIGLDLDSTITSWNQGAQRMYGYTAQEAIGQSIKLLYLPDDNSELFMDRIKRGERVEHTEARRRRKDGATIEEAITISPIVDGMGALIGSSKIARDVTDSKRAEIEREHLIRQLRETARFKDEFLAVMSHELRTPLNAILGLLGIVLMGKQVTSRDEMMLVRVRANGERLLNIINNILDISRIEAGRLTIVPTAVSLPQMVDKLRSDMSVLADQKHLAFDAHIAETTPDVVMIDEDALNKIMVNLVGNAFKFTENGRVSLDVSATASDLTIVVSDTGIGIPAHMQEIIFESFRQVDSSSTRAFGGSGLGLSIVRSLCMAMKGTVRLESQPGQGSTFTVTLPLQSEQVAA